jgi:predicted DNA-binding transcriptional regulator YafY
LQRDKVTSQELAEKFEVSRRTILRDIESIDLAGIPIVSEQGQEGA